MPWILDGLDMPWVPNFGPVTATHGQHFTKQLPKVLKTMGLVAAGCAKARLKEAFCSATKTMKTTKISEKYRKSPHESVNDPPVIRWQLGLPKLTAIFWTDNQFMAVPLVNDQSYHGNKDCPSCLMRVSGSTILSICTMSSGCCWIDPVGRGDRWHHEFSPSDIKSDQNRNIKKQLDDSGCKNATSRCKFCGFSQANDSAFSQEASGSSCSRDERITSAPPAHLAQKWTGLVYPLRHI